MTKRALINSHKEIILIVMATNVIILIIMASYVVTIDMIFVMG